MESILLLIFFSKWNCENFKDERKNMELIKAGHLLWKTNEYTEYTHIFNRDVYAGHNYFLLFYIIKIKFETMKGDIRFANTVHVSFSNVQIVKLF